MLRFTRIGLISDSFAVFKFGARRLSTGSFRPLGLPKVAVKAAPAPPARVSKLALLLGGSLVSGVYLANNSLVKNDAAAAGYKYQVGTTDAGLPKVKKSLDYQDLTYGSIFGLFFGVIIGKLSYILGVISLGGFFALEFLEQRGIIKIPWNGIVTFGKQRINLKALLLENPSFKLTFLLSFLIAAWNI